MNEAPGEASFDDRSIITKSALRLWLKKVKILANKWIIWDSFIFLYLQKVSTFLYNSLDTQVFGLQLARFSFPTTVGFDMFPQP